MPAWRDQHHHSGTTRSSKIDLGLGDALARPIAGSRCPMIQPLALAAHRDEARGSPAPPRSLEDAREDQVQARHAAAGDPVLLTIYYVVVAAPLGARGHGRSCHCRHRAW